MKPRVEKNLAGGLGHYKTPISSITNKYICLYVSAWATREENGNFELFTNNLY